MPCELQRLACRRDPCLPSWKHHMKSIAPGIRGNAEQRPHEGRITAARAQCTGAYDNTAPPCMGVSNARCFSVPPSNGASNLEWIDSLDLWLSKTERAVLRYIVMQEPRWLTREMIIAACFGTNHATDTSLVRVHVHAIRRKLGPLGQHVQSQRGRGYRFLSSP